jgi:hypothetical protein
MSVRRAMLSNQDSQEPIQPANGVLTGAAKFALLWLPVCGAGLAVYFLGIPLVSVVLTLLGSKPDAPLLTQPNGHGLLIGTIVLLCVTAAASFLLAHMLGALYLLATRPTDGLRLSDTLLSRSYPASWFHKASSERLAQ